MQKFPDCDGIKILYFPEEGNGKCRVCHGQGKTSADQFFDSFLGGKSECLHCNGSGECPICRGSGVIN